MNGQTRTIDIYCEQLQSAPPSATGTKMRPLAVSLLEDLNFCEGQLLFAEICTTKAFGDEDETKASLSKWSSSSPPVPVQVAALPWLLVVGGVAIMGYATFAACREANAAINFIGFCQR